MKKRVLVEYRVAIIVEKDIEKTALEVYDIGKLWHFILGQKCPVWLFDVKTFNVANGTSDYEAFSERM